MNKEKFHIPMPDEETIQREIKDIVASGVKRQRSFPSFLIELYKEIGLRYLFMNKKDGILISLSAMVMFIFLFFIVADVKHIHTGEVYAFVFLVSPLLYVALSLYDLLHKRYSATYEVEMVTKYNVYQVVAFRMLHFSVISILINTICMIALVWMDDRLQFFRAFMISTTALFLFSVLFLLALMRGRSGMKAIWIGIGWIMVNVIMNQWFHPMYMNFLNTGPIVLYAVVLAISVGMYIYYLSKLVRMKPAEGVY